MRRALSAVVRYLATLASSLARGWNDFWYTPADPSLLGLIRILTGLVLLVRSRHLGHGARQISSAPIPGSAAIWSMWSSKISMRILSGGPSPRAGSGSPMPSR